MLLSHEGALNSDEPTASPRIQACPRDLLTILQSAFFFFSKGNDTFVSERTKMMMGQHVEGRFAVHERSSPLSRTTEEILAPPDLAPQVPAARLIGLPCHDNCPRTFACTSTSPTVASLGYMRATRAPNPERMHSGLPESDRAGWASLRVLLITNKCLRKIPDAAHQVGRPCRKTINV